MPAERSFCYAIEHMEEDDAETRALPEWVRLEYAHMLNLVGPTSAVLFTSLSSSSVPPLKDYLSSRSASSTSSSPSATSSSSAPKEKEKAQLYTTSILDTLAGKSPPVPFSRVCLLDPRAPAELSPADADLFDVFLYGGILGDDPPRDRTGELRKLGFQGRHLGEKQMTTDTAVGVTKMVIEDGVELNEIPYTDFPTIHFSKHESIEMPFRYVADDKGEPILPPGMKDHLKADLDRTIDDF